MAERFRHDESAKYIIECTDRWYLKDLSRRRTELIKTEMEPSVREARDNGRLLEEVFGPASEWAECWSEVYRTEQGRRQRQVYRLSGMVFLTLLVSSLVILAHYLLYSSSNFSLDLGTFVLTAFMAAAVNLSMPSGVFFRFFDPVKRIGRFTYGSCLVCFATSLLGLYVLLRSERAASAGIIEWSRSYSLLLVIATVVAGVVYLGRDRSRTSEDNATLNQYLGLIPTDENALRRRRKADRAVLVAVFTSVLAFGSVWALTPPSAYPNLGLWLFLSGLFLVAHVADMIGKRREYSNDNNA